MTNKSMQRMDFCISKAKQLTTLADSMNTEAGELTEQAKILMAKSDALLIQAQGYMDEATRIKNGLVAET